MRRLRQLVIAALAISSSGAWAKDVVLVRQPELIPADKVIALPDAIALTLQNQPTIRQAGAQVVIQTGAARQSRSALLPSLDVTSSAAIVGNRNNIGTTVSETINQLIFDFSRSRNLLDQSRQQLAAAQYGLSVATLSATFTVKQDYYAALRTARLVQVFETNVKDQDEHVSQAQARFGAGLAPKSDVLNAQAAAASARVDLVTARNNAAQARVDLNIAMGVDVRGAFQISETTEPEFPVPSLDDAVNLAIKNRPEMCQAIDQAASAVAALRAARTGNLPTLTTSLGQNQVSGGQFLSPRSINWLVNLTWTPFDSGFTRGAVFQAEGQLENTQENVYTVSQTVSRDVASARLNVLTAQESLASARVEVAAATENLAVATGRYAAGVGIFLEVLDAQGLLLKAQVDEATALYGLSTARAQLEHAIGVNKAEGTLK